MAGNQLYKAARISKSRCFLLFMILSGILLVENMPFVNICGSNIYIYIVKPIIWLFIGFLVWALPRIKPNGKIRLNSFIMWWTGYLAAAYIIFMMIGGLIEGFGKSPYDLSVKGILINIIMIASTLFGKEYSRSYLVNSLAGKHPVIIMALITILMTILNLPLNMIKELKDVFAIIQYIGEYILPELSKNIMAAYLVYLGGPALSILYLGIIQCFQWFCPILPDLTWITKALIGTVCPVFSLMFIQYIYSEGLEGARSRYKEKESPLGWIITSVVSISIVWFAVGVFPIRPAVIATGSMKPVINPGDMVLVKRVELNDLKIGDIIEYKKDDIRIFHRIIDTKMDANQLIYVTKGDNNSIPDSEPVKVEDIKGKVVYVIPKAGWLTLTLRRKNAVPEEKVEF